MTKNYYDILGVNKSASEADIKKAYRKNAMKYHPDKNKGNASAEAKFKEVNEAYDTLGNKQKRKNYDTFGSSKGNPFAGAGKNNTGGQRTYTYSGTGGTGGFEDIFSAFGGGGNSRRTQSAGFDFSDLFGGAGQSQSRPQEKPKPENLDIEVSASINFFDFLFGTSVEVSNTKGKKVTIKIPANTKPGSKKRVKGYGISKNGKTGNLIIKLEAKMPKNISEVDKKLLEQIKDNIGY